MPNFYIIAGPNWAGKTTASYTFLPQVLKCTEFINADEIARGLSPFKPENASFEAGRIMLQQIDKHIGSKVDFAIETTLSTKYYFQLIRKARSKGYKITLLFLWLPSVKTAKERVKKRVSEGGHDIPSEVIKRRYKRGLENFFRIFIDSVDQWIFVNNADKFKVIARRSGRLEIIDENLFNKLKAKYA